MRVSADATVPPVISAHEAFVEYFCCPTEFAAIDAPQSLSTTDGYFAFAGATCYGRFPNEPARQASESLADVIGAVEILRDCVRLPFDLGEVVTNLRQERYCPRPDGWLQSFAASSAVRQAYYFHRPLMAVGIRKHLQRLRFRGWERIAFPQWPVDDSVDRIFRATMAFVMKRAGVAEVPFIWFWRDGASGCVMVTHDIEGSAGAEFSRSLAALDQSFGIPSAFQIIPRSPLERSLVADLRRAGCEVNLHDLDHDGYLFHDHDEFKRRASEINQYAREFGCQGFRSGAMYREQAWYDAFEFSYDMSVPNAAHLEPQRGGCCTVMPYFVGRLLELPLTTTQDYSLFHILGEYSADRWKQQTEMLLSRNGLISFIAHPDYLIESRPRAVYVDLLGYLSQLRAERKVWIARPGEVNDWWRLRRRMKLVRDGASWRVCGRGSERARIAYATLEGENVTYRVTDQDGSRVDGMEGSVARSPREMAS
jgi:hypothetical protein